jgi:hypothetical protein
MIRLLPQLKLRLDVATSGLSVHGTYIALEPSLDGKETKGGGSEFPHHEVNKTAVLITSSTVVTVEPLYFTKTTLIKRFVLCLER